MDTEHLYSLMTETFKWDKLSRGDYFIDYQNLYTHLGVSAVRGIFVSCAKAFLKAGQRDRSLEMLDRCSVVMEHYPLETIPLGFSGNDYMVIDMIDLYYTLGEADKARELASRLGEDLLATARFYLEFYDFAKDDFEMAGNYIYYLSDALKKGGDAGMGETLTKGLTDLVHVASSDKK